MLRRQWLDEAIQLCQQVARRGIDCRVGVLRGEFERPREGQEITCRAARIKPRHYRADPGARLDLMLVGEALKDLPDRGTADPEFLGKAVLIKDMGLGGIHQADAHPQVLRNVI